MHPAAANALSQKVLYVRVTTWDHCYGSFDHLWCMCVSG